MLSEEKSNNFNCSECGAELKFKAGTEFLECGHCGNKNKILQTKVEIQEIDYNEYIKNMATQEKVITIKAINCSSCGATSSVDSHVKADLCPYCATPFVLEDAKDQDIIKPKNLLPFKLDKTEATNSFKKWIKSLWFAPNSLGKAALNPVSFKSIYLPYWTFDSDTFSKYTGQRGDDYYVTVGSGKDQKREKRTRWTSVSGTVSKKFDDVLVPATKSVPYKRLDALRPWNLHQLVNYDERYLSGHQTECYAIELEKGNELARREMAVSISYDAKSQIGGDQQSITSLYTTYSDVTFKHILLPVYVCSYRYKQKLYNFVINAQTGEVQGDRPYSILKILAVVLCIVAIFGVLYILEKNGYLKIAHR